MNSWSQVSTSPTYVEMEEEKEKQSIDLFGVNKHPVTLTYLFPHDSFQHTGKILAWEERCWLHTVWLLLQAVLGCQEPPRSTCPCLPLGDDAVKTKCFCRRVSGFALKFNESKINFQNQSYW